jgi:hypothetical protein
MKPPRRMFCAATRPAHAPIGDGSVQFVTNPARAAPSWRRGIVDRAQFARRDGNVHCSVPLVASRRVKFSGTRAPKPWTCWVGIGVAEGLPNPRCFVVLLRTALSNRNGAREKRPEIPAFRIAHPANAERRVCCFGSVAENWAIRQTSDSTHTAAEQRCGAGDRRAAAYPCSAGRDDSRDPRAGKSMTPRRSSPHGR